MYYSWFSKLFWLICSTRVQWDFSISKRFP